MTSAAPPIFKFYRTAYHFVVHSTQLQHVAAGTKTQLVVERSTGRAFDGENFNPLSEAGLHQEDLILLEIFAFLGAVRLEGGTVWVVVTDAGVVATLGANKIFCVKAVELVPINPHWQPDAEETSTLLELKKKVQGKKGRMHTTANPRFYWNREMYQDLERSGVSDKWFVPAIQGFVTSSNEFLQGSNAQIVLISRRSCLRGGCSNAESGIDDDGNVANFVETEQIVKLGSAWYSLVQVRGSVPLFWQLAGASDSSRSIESTSPAFIRHFTQMIQNYSRVMVINLLTSTKSEENSLNELFNRLMLQHQSQMEKYVCYYAFDMRSQGRSVRPDSLIVQIQEMLTYYSFYCMSNSQPQMLQKGVPRINCYDCLDRTNQVMARIAWEVLMNQFKMNGVDFQVDYDTTQLPHPLLKSFRNMWADTGDMLSRLYTGVGSGSAHAARTGKSGLKSFIDSKVKAVERFINSGWEKRQEVIDLILRARKSARAIPPSIAHRESEFVKTLSLAVHVCTWNMAGNRAPKKEDLSDWLIDSSNPLPELVVVGLQEMVPLNTKNVLASGNLALIEDWKELVLSALNRGGRANYQFVQVQDMVGCMLVLFAQGRMMSHFRGISRDLVKVGFGNMAGNKGGVLVRLQIKDTSICFWNCHLESGMEQTEARLSQLEDICARAFAGSRTVPGVDEHDVKVLLGDLNFRIGLRNLEVRNLLASNDLERLKQSDQLLANKNRSAILAKYVEGNITFPPTYKYDKDSNEYDTSKKMRVPAWCDRILVCGKDVILTSYRRSEYRYSDHRPVSATMMIPIKEIQQDRMREIEEQEKSRMSLPAAAIRPVQVEEEYERSARTTSEYQISPALDLLSLGDEVSRPRARTTMPVVTNISEARVRPPSGNFRRVEVQSSPEDRKQTDLMSIGADEFLDFNVKSRPRPTDPQSFV